jgi:protein TonB
MPLNITRFFIISLVIFSFNIILFAQAANDTAQQTAAVITTQGPSSAEVMRMRISKAKANIAVRNYTAALYELETISRETSDPAVNSVVDGLLVHIYLEQGDYDKARKLLAKTYDSYRSNNAFAEQRYYAVAGQVVKGSRNKAARYLAFGITPSDRDLPLEAANDIEQMRQIVELVINQAKELGSDKEKSASAAGLLEEATTSRSMIARDDYDAKRWRDAIADSREDIANSQSKIISAVQGEMKPDAEQVAAAQKPPTQAPPKFEPVPEVASPTETKPAVQKTVETTPEKPGEKKLVISTPKASEPAPQNKPTEPQTPERKRVIPDATTGKAELPSEKPEETDQPAAAGPLEIGSLIGYATQRAPALYPPLAKRMRTTGVVRVEVLIGEDGHVEEIQSLSGPNLLQQAASDAVRKWRFKPFTRNGDPVKAVGFVNFNFSL